MGSLTIGQGIPFNATSSKCITGGSCSNNTFNQNFSSDASSSLGQSPLPPLTVPQFLSLNNSKVQHYNFTTTPSAAPENPTPDPAEQPSSEMTGEEVPIKNNREISTLDLPVEEEILKSKKENPFMNSGTEISEGGVRYHALEKEQEELRDPSTDKLEGSASTLRKDLYLNTAQEKRSIWQMIVNFFTPFFPPPEDTEFLGGLELT